MSGNFASRALCVVVAVLALVLAIGVMTFASACVHDDGTTSICHTAQLAVAAAGVVIVVLAVIARFLKNAKASGIMLLVAAAVGLAVALVPGNALPLCMMETMRCHIVMQPFSQLIGVAIAAVALIAGIRLIRMHV